MQKLAAAENVLRTALHRSPLLDNRPYEIFGQGSRVNNTYLDPASDIDLVLMLEAPTADYGWAEFRDDVVATLAESYTVRMGRRCVNVDDPGSQFGEMVDILVATQHQEGVFFLDQEGRPIVNFPKQHRRNGDDKDRRTGGRFKQVVRETKRRRLPVLPEAPSYLLECLLYNVPDEVYRTATPGDALAWLHRFQHEDPGGFAALPCQNGINRLFGSGPDQWDAGEAARIVDVLRQL
ncbi:hypothetical protein BJ973_002466 [Actinoplanes tereljensis]|uniref:Nucleotidyltransferase n=1 Tax=Paractinoplanes tereljensis TaxID=571912 RepID=A0A919NNJ5_9ACTN|nr:hypothetical protein [Actinoplanes tereljensis]GIF22141.1 nucleotidyltransferase [Actinoplanes tereljensis]